MGSAIVIVLSVAMAIAMVITSEATQYTVGGTAGWDASTDFNTWLMNKTFVVGDTLVFQYSSLHSVMVVNKSGYDSCQTSNALQSFTDGNTQIKLSKPGSMYFICGTPGHCVGGMKMGVNNIQAATASSPSSPPGASASPSKPNPSTPSTTSPTTPAKQSPVGKSAATSISHSHGNIFGIVIAVVGLLLSSFI